MLSNKFPYRCVLDKTYIFILSSVLTNCTECKERCAVAKETFQDELYLKFKKGDSLQITDKDLEVNGWWYALNIRTRQEGYVYPFYIRTVAGLIGALAFLLYGLTLNGFDVVTDILSGKIYLDGDSLPENNSLINCSHFNSYSHPTWGFMSIGLAWLPAFPLFIILIFSLLNFKGGTGRTNNRRKTVVNCFSLFLVCLLWPISSFLM